MQPLKASDIASTESERQIVGQLLAMIADNEMLPGFRLLRVERLSDAASTLLIQLTNAHEPDCIYGDEDDEQLDVLTDELPELARSLSQEHSCNVIARYSAEDDEISLGQRIVLDPGEAYTTATDILAMSDAVEATEYFKAALLLCVSMPATPRELTSILVGLAQSYLESERTDLCRACLDECRRWVETMEERNLIYWLPSPYAEMAGIEARLGNYDCAKELIERDHDLSSTLVGLKGEMGEPPDTQGMTDEDSDRVIERYLLNRETSQNLTVNRLTLLELVEHIRTTREEQNVELTDLLTRIGTLRNTSLD